MTPAQTLIFIIAGALVIWIVATEIKRRIYLARRRRNAPGGAP